MKQGRPLAALLALLALGGCQPKAAGADDAAFGARVRAYLLAHPEVLQEASQKLDAKVAADDAADRRSAQQKLPGLRAALERDPHDYVANPLGSVTLTEFYDYRCPHCISAAPQVMAMIRQHPDVRFVFKEMPIFGATSQHAARAALAVKAAGGDYVGLYQAFMATPALDDQTIDRLAAAKGARARDMAPDAASEALAQIARNDALFEQLDLGGTPAFIVGDQMILGDDMKALTAAVAHARAVKEAVAKATTG
jgi:protein-disulfide isomerase